MCESGFNLDGQDQSKLKKFLVSSNIFIPSYKKQLKVHLNCIGTHYPEFIDLDIEGVAFVPPEDSDLMVLVAQNYFQEEIEAELANSQRPVLLWVPYGDQVSVGPLYDGTETTCYQCFRKSVIRNCLSDFDTGPLEYPAIVSKVNLKLAVGLLEQELSKIHKSDFLKQNVVLFNAAFRNYEICEVYSSPGCKLCNIDYDETLRNVAFLPGTLRESSSSEAFKKVKKLVNPLTGVLNKIIPNNNMAPGATIGLSSLGIKSKFLIDNVAFSMGKGSSKELSELSCIGEAVERSTMSNFHRTGFLTGELATLRADYECISPDDLELFSEKQRLDWKKLPENSFKYKAGVFVSPRLDPSEPIDWKRSFNLTRNEECLLPCSYLYRWDLLSDEEIYCVPNSTGMASGFNTPEAIIHGTMELIERDAVGMWWYNELSLPEIKVKDLSSDFCFSVFNFFKHRGRLVHLLYAKTDYKAHTVIAVSSDENGNDVNVGFGTGFVLKAAAERAMGELSQVTVFKYSGEQVSNSTLSFSDNLCFLPNTKISFRELYDQDFEFSNSSQAIEHIVQDAKEKGHSVIYTNMNSEFPMTVVKVVIPGLIKHYSRFGNPRLFDLPVKMGYLKAKKSEGELNPISYEAWKKNLWSAKT